MAVLEKDKWEVAQTFHGGTIAVFSFSPEMFNDALYFKEIAENLPEDPSAFEQWRYLRASIIFSFTAIESYINTFIEKSLENKKLIVSNENEKFLKNILVFLKKHLKSRSIEEKLKVGVKLITGKEIDTRSSEYSGFIHLKDIRNKLIHSKSEEETYRIHREDITIENANKAIETVRGLIKKIHELDGTPYPQFVDRKQSEPHVISSITPL